VADSYVIGPGALDVRPVGRASVLLGLHEPGVETVAAALDVDRNEFVQLPALPLGRAWRLLSLSPDGARLLYLGPHRGSHFDGLYLHTLASGDQAVFDAVVDGPIEFAAISPNGRNVATLSTPYDPGSDAPIAAVGLFDVATGQHRRLWATPGYPPAESVVSWSPDSARLAVTYGNPRRGNCTVVLDAVGRIVGRYHATQALPSGNGDWLDNEHLIGAWADERNGQQLTILNVTDGTRQLLSSYDALPIGRLDDRLVVHNTQSGDEYPSRFGDAQLLTTDMRGSDPRPFIAVRASRHVAPIEMWATPYDLH
jgi:dipeptidyl aminopeptidase/acylaminoacyl peptidase